MLDHSSDFNLEWIFFIIADKRNKYKSLDEFEFRQDPITYYGVSSLEHLKNLWIMLWPL